MRKPPQSFRVAGLFAGIGGFERAFKLEGSETTLLCEKDPVASHVLRSRFQELRDDRFVEDVRDLDALPSRTNVVCAGFPCQDLSSVGEKQGISGDRSFLVSEVFRLIEAHDVDWVVIENVMFMLHLGKGAAMRFITSAFDAMGFRWAYRLIDSSSFGVPQRRRRVYFVASRHHDPRPVLLNPERKPATFDPDISRPVGFYWTEGTYARGLADDSVPPLKGGSTVGIPSPPAVLLPNGEAVLPGIEDAERLQGFPRGWTRHAEEVARASFRWRLVGNAVTVDAARWIAKRLKDPQQWHELESQPFSAADRWPNAAWGHAGARFAVDRSDRPAKRKAPSLETVLLDPRKPLSRRATLGFLSRARKGNLNYPEGFLDALDRHAASMTSSRTT